MFKNANSTPQHYKKSYFVAFGSFRHFHQYRYATVRVILLPFLLHLHKSGFDHFSILLLRS